MNRFAVYIRRVGVSEPELATLPWHRTFGEVPVVSAFLDGLAPDSYGEIHVINGEAHTIGTTAGLPDLVPSALQGYEDLVRTLKLFRMSSIAAAARFVREMHNVDGRSCAEVRIELSDQMSSFEGDPEMQMLRLTHGTLRVIWIPGLAAIRIWQSEPKEVPLVVLPAIPKRNAFSGDPELNETVIKAFKALLVV